MNCQVQSSIKERVACYWKGPGTMTLEIERVALCFSSTRLSCSNPRSCLPHDSTGHLKGLQRIQGAYLIMFMFILERTWRLFLLPSKT